MKKYIGVLTLMGLFLIMPFASHGLDDPTDEWDTPSARVEVPTNVSLSSTEETIDVTWDGDSDMDAYNIYWGTSSDNLDQSAEVQDPTEEYTITGLDSGTEYFVAVSAVNNENESSRSPVQSIMTEEETEAPAAPDGFGITDISDITEISAKFSWAENSESDLEKYIIHYGTASGDYNDETVADAGTTEKTVSGLNSGTRYFFTITAVDESDNESDKAEEVVVDTLPDTRAPFKPDGISGALAGAGEINISIDSANEQMADFAGNNIYYGTASGQYDYSVDIGKAGSHVFTELPEDADNWYFAASAYDNAGNESARTDETSVRIEDISLFLNESGDYDGGCFIAGAGQSDRSSILWPIIGSLFAAGLAIILGYLVKRLPAAGLILIIVVVGGGYSQAEQWQPAGNNTVGLTGGYYVAAESDYRDVYGKNSYPVSIFYDRFITRHISIEIESGYFQDSGDLLTASGESTDISAKIEMVPTAASIKFHFPIADYVTGYVGVGPDYWYVKEETDDSSLLSSVEEWVGGYHGKIGFKFYNTDEDFKGTGALIETGYSSVDRLGDNDLDIGGWMSEFGLFYQF
ncbi:MAG: fibronectin type III domain-containing protein [Desulfobacterales bacterium]